MLLVSRSCTVDTTADPPAGPRRRWLTWLSPGGLIAAAVAFAIVDVADQLAGDAFLPAAPLDETAHLLTTLIVLWAVGGVVFERMLYPALVASVAIDLDHVPAQLGYRFLTAGTPRPYTHSLLTIVVVLAIALVWRRRREMWLGVAAGLTLHLWRDTAEPGSGVALLWPFSDHSVSLSPVVYLSPMAVAVATGMGRSLREQRRRAARRT